MSMTTEKKIKFDTDGWQAVIADDFTFENVWKATRAIAFYLETAYTQDRLVLIGYDSRFLADRFAYSAAEILTDFGWVVKITDRDSPTPTIVHGLSLLNSAGALIFGSNHPRANYCGIKYIPDSGSPATTKIIDIIANNLDRATNIPPVGKNNGQIRFFDPKTAYLDHLYGLLDLATLRNAVLKVKYDAGNSTSRGYLDEILLDCDIELESFHATRDVLFGSETVEPKVDRLQQLMESVKKDKADFGVVTNSESTQSTIVDDRGQILAPNIISALLKSLEQSKVRSGAKRAEGIEDIARNDGILTSMLIAEAIAVTGKPLSQLAEETAQFR
jgi:phosphomannomutase